jgi:DNA-binding NtrC family response regulator
MAEPLDILVVDDEEAICFALKRYFEARGYAVRVAGSGEAGLVTYRDRPADVVFLDVRLPDAGGLDVLEDLRREDPDARVVIMTAYGSLETVTRALRGAAFEYIVKPLDLERAGEIVRQVEASRRAGAPAGRAASVEGEGEPLLVGRSAAIQEVYKRIARAADSDAICLIVGETGTGKERVARAIHEHSRRRSGPFVAVGGGALPETLAESELFGYIKGAFTGADADKPGHFQAADGGTLFLDEVGEMPPGVQVKLLRFLDDQSITPLGAVQPVRLDVRVLAATNRDLARAVAEGRFREDLYYRLAVLRIEVAPLSARPEDVLPLARHFLSEIAPGGQAPPIGGDAARCLERYAWPGNVRELRAAMEHACVMSGGGPILPAHLPQAVRLGRSVAPGGEDADALLERWVDALAAGPPERFRGAMQELEKTLIARALRESGGNQSAAAERLGMHRNTLRAKVREYGLET